MNWGRHAIYSSGASLRAVLPNGFLFAIPSISGSIPVFRNDSANNFQSNRLWDTAE